MQERVPCEFCLMRYVPDVVRGEFVTIGVLLREVGGDGGAAGAVRAGTGAGCASGRGCGRGDAGGA